MAAVFSVTPAHAVSTMMVDGSAAHRPSRHIAYTKRELCSASFSLLCVHCSKLRDCIRRVTLRAARSPSLRRTLPCALRKCTAFCCTACAHLLETQLLHDATSTLRTTHKCSLRSMSCTACCQSCSTATASGAKAVPLSLCIVRPLLSQLAATQHTPVRALRAGALLTPTLLGALRQLYLRSQV